MPLDLDSCIAGTYTPGNIGASSGMTPVSPSAPSLEDPDNYDPDAMTYSLQFQRFYNSLYVGVI